MPSPSQSRSRRSRAPSPEQQRQTGTEILGKVAKGVLEYSIYHYLSQKSSAAAKPAHSSSEQSPSPMPPKRPSSSDRSRAFGSDSRRDHDPMHEIVSHLLRGAAALAARHFIHGKKQKKEAKTQAKTKSRSSRPSRDEFAARPDMERHRHRHHHRHSRRNDRHGAPRPELVVALDSLSAELARTTSRIRQLAGRRPPHRHRGGRCDVYEGLVSCASRLQGETERVRAGVNNIRNLGDEALGAPIRRRGDGWQRNRGDEIDGIVGERSRVRMRSAPDVKEEGADGRRVRVGEEPRGRKRTRSR